LEPQPFILSEELFRKMAAAIAEDLVKSRAETTILKQSMHQQWRWIDLTNEEERRDGTVAQKLICTSGKEGLESHPL
jgi:hypothetical protein